jgi:hypothetical protein
VPNLSSKAERLTPVKAVAAYCQGACPRTQKNASLHDDGWWFADCAVHACRQRTCPLWSYRDGKQPGRAGIGGRPSQRAKITAPRRT